MYIRLFLILLILGLNLNIFGQKEKFRFSARTGLNLAYLEYLDPDANALFKQVRTAKPGFVVGAVATVRLNPVLNVEAELVYTQKGLRYSQPEFFKVGRNTMNYIEIPISGHFLSLKKKREVWDFFVGAYAGYWTDGKYIVKNKLSGEVVKPKIDFSNDLYSYNRTDLGFLAGFSLYSQNKNWAFDVKYAHGFASLAHQGVDETEHRVITIGCKYIFLKTGKI